MQQFLLGICKSLAACPMGFSMNLSWLSEKGAGLTAAVVGLAFIALSFLHVQYRYFYFCVAIVVFLYSYRQFKKRDTPFEKHERELRRKTM